MFAKVAEIEGVWIGNTAPPGIDAVIQLDKQIPTMQKQNNTFEFILPNTELMPDEFRKVILKLETVADTIRDLRDSGQNILVACEDARNKCVLAVGYYLVKRGGMKPDDVIKSLENIYYSQDQKNDEQRDDNILQRAILNDTDPQYSSDQLKKQAERRALKCLTNRSYRTLLKSVKK